MENKLKKYKIYSIRSYNDKSVIYYDYTTQFLHKRLSAIKSRYTRYLNNMDNYIVSFELFKLGNVYIELEEELECINREHLNAVLNKYIRDNDCLNKSYYDNIVKETASISVVCNNNINQQHQLTLYKSTPYIEEIHKDIKNIKKDNNVILAKNTDNINTDKNNNVILAKNTDNINTDKNKNVILTDKLDNINTSGIVKEKLNGLMNIQPPTINNIKTIDIQNKNDNDELEHYKQKYLYSNIDDNNSIKSLASSVIKSNRKNKTIRIDITSHKKTLKKRNYSKE